MLPILKCVFAEPIGSVKPHVNIGDKTNIANGKINHSLSLLCIATGWPVLSFRLIQTDFFLLFFCVCISLALALFLSLFVYCVQIESLATILCFFVVKFYISNHYKVQ